MRTAIKLRKLTTEEVTEIKRAASSDRFPRSCVKNSYIPSMSNSSPEFHRI